MEEIIEIEFKCNDCGNIFMEDQELDGCCYCDKCDSDDVEVTNE